MDFAKPYIPKKRKYYKNIQNYQYKAYNLSLTYKYVISPLCDKIVSYLPLNLSSNIITILGFLVNLTPLILTIYYTGLNGKLPCPKWLCFFSSICYFLYQIFDNCNSKQARRSNSTNPLEFLLDHCFDSCVSFFIILILGSIIGIDDIWSYFMLFLMTTAPFYFCTWEMLINGELIFPKFNGISDGMIIIILIELFTSISGTNFWKKGFMIFNSKISINSIFCLIGMCSGLFYCGLSIYNVLIKQKNEKMIKNFLHLIFYCLLIICFGFVIMIGNKSQIVSIYPKVIVLLFGFEFAKVMGLMYLSIIMNKEFQPYTIITVVPILCIMSFIILHNIFKYEFNFTNEDGILIFFFFYNFVAWGHFMYYCFTQMCEILNINILTVSRREQNDVSVVDIHMSTIQEEKKTELSE